MTINQMSKEDYKITLILLSSFSLKELFPNIYSYQIKNLKAFIANIDMLKL